MPERCFLWLNLSGVGSLMGPLPPCRSTRPKAGWAGDLSKVLTLDCRSVFPPAMLAVRLSWQRVHRASLVPAMASWPLCSTWQVMQLLLIIGLPLVMETSEICLSEWTVPLWHLRQAASETVLKNL